MFHFASDPYYRPMPEAILSELMSAITNKLKIVVCPSNVFSFLYDILSGPETLVVTYDYSGSGTNKCENVAGDP